MKELGKILRFVYPYRGQVILHVLFNLLSVIFSLFSVSFIIPFLGILFKTQPLLDNPGELSLDIDSFKDHFYYFLSEVIREEGEIRALFYVSICIVSMAFLRNLFRYLAMYFLSPIRNNIVRDIRNKLYDKVLRLPLSYFSDEKKGDIISRMTGDVQEIEWSIIASLEILFNDPLTIIFYMGALFFMSFELTLFVFLILPVSGYLIARIGKSLKKNSLRGQRKMGILVSIMEETLTGIRIIKAFNAQGKMNSRFTSINSFYTQIMTKIHRRRYLAGPISEFLGTIVMVIIMIYGSVLILNNMGGLSPQAFMAYLMLFYLVIGPSKQLTTAYYNIQKGLASVDRLNHILNADISISEKPEAHPLHEFKESIEFHNVSFKYSRDDVLKNISLKIEKGKTIALVGHSGSGKSTLVDLIPRFFDVTGGMITIDRIPITEYKIVDLRNIIGFVNQEPILFNDTFYKNIALGDTSISVDQVVEAAKIANAHHFIMETKNGYHTNIGDKGNKISGGEKQRISIARAVLKNPPILILDEATSSLDTESEKLVQDAIYNLMKNRTSIVIAHRLSTVRDADMIYVIDNGTIIEKGKHTELMKTKGIYKKLNDLQMFS